jgi:methylthioribose-1-phosphate isomerase
MSAVQSPLFEPVLWLGTGFKILDESQIPEKLEYLAVNDVGQALDAVQEMRTRAFGQVLTFLYSGALLAQSHPVKDVGALRRRLAKMTQQFCDARPTFDFRGLGSFFEKWLDELPSGGDPREAIATRAREFGQHIVRGRSARAKRAAAILPNPACVMTHCNVSGELVAVALHCKHLGKELSVIATETRPYLQGTRLTAWELAQAGVPVSIIPDAAVAEVIDQGPVNAVIVGADRSAQNGDIINKVGTYPLALIAKEYGVPFHALVQDPRSLLAGADVPIEERPAAELLTFQGKSLVPSSVGSLHVRYPSFDVTPAALITYLIDFDAIYTPESFRQKFQVQPTQQTRNGEPSGKYVLVYGVPPESQYAFLRSALRAEQAESVLVPEMRPQLWGAQRVVPELLELKIPVTLISDNTMGTLFAQGEIRKVCLFYDKLTDAGPGGICGSLLAARLAGLHNVGVELFSGAEQRGATLDKDASTFLGKNICPAGANVRPGNAEVIPWSLLRKQKN